MPLKIDNQEMIHMRNTNIFFEALFYQINLMISKKGIHLNQLNDMVNMGYPTTIDEFDFILDAQVRGMHERNEIIEIMA